MIDTAFEPFYFHKNNWHSKNEATSAEGGTFHFC
jgi:hypothetical protein